jgi:putative endonuclease
MFLSNPFKIRILFDKENAIIMGFMYILKCCDDSYYTGSTVNLERRFLQHINGQGANYTKKRLPVELMYFEEYARIDEAFYREKQIQGWTHGKKKALIEGRYDDLPALARKIWRRVTSIRN